MGSQTISVGQGRVLLVVAAVLWSLSGAFTKVLTQQAFFQIGPAPLHGLEIAFFRAFFAGLILIPTLRPRDLSFGRMILVMVFCFAVMNALYVTAQAWGTAANAVFLQYTAPMWMYLASIWWLGEQPDRRSSIALFIGLVGIAIIIWGGWQEAQFLVVVIALVSGFAYAGVILCLRVLRDASSAWLTVINHLCAALLLIPFLWYFAPANPSPAQLVILFFFGVLQMALPYWLTARAMRVVSPQEAGTITLLEPLLNPLWAYLVAPQTEIPSLFTFIGGAFILGALAWRYWPRKRATPSDVC